MTTGVADKTVFVTLCNAPHFHRAKQTIKDLRTKGGWTGDIVLIAVDCEAPAEFLTEYRVESVSFPQFDLGSYLDKIRAKPFTDPTNDGREHSKTVQWEKLHAFEPWFQERWDRVVFLDAGLRVLAPVGALLSLPWRGRFLAPDDTQGKTHRFGIAVERVNWPEALSTVQRCYGVDLDSRYFLNCMWVYDTALRIPVSEFLEMLAFPIWRHNEMGAMNAVLTFNHRIWTPFPPVVESGPLTGKYLFDWCELNRRGTFWTDYCFLKYPVTIKFD